MKKNIVMLVALCVPFAHGMEPESKQWSITAYGTTINLTKGNMLDTYADGKKRVDFIVVGRYEQLLKGNGTWYEDAIGEFNDISNVVFVPKNNQHNYTHDKWNKRPEVYRFPQQKNYNFCMKIVEPYYKKDQGTYSKYVWYGRMIEEPSFSGDEAIEEVLNDLKLCYSIILKNLQSKTKKRSIALPTLSADIGFPRDKAVPAAVMTIVGFIKNYPEVYNCIELFVEEDFEYDLYKELLEKSSTEQ